MAQPINSNWNSVEGLKLGVYRTVYVAEWAEITPEQCMCIVLPASGESFRSEAPLEMHLLRNLKMCIVPVLPAVHMTVWRAWLWSIQGAGTCRAPAAPTWGVGMVAEAGCTLAGRTLGACTGAWTVRTSSTPTPPGDAGGVVSARTGSELPDS